MRNKKLISFLFLNLTILFVFLFLFNFSNILLILGAVISAIGFFITKEQNFLKSFSKNKLNKLFWFLVLILFPLFSHNNRYVIHIIMIAMLYSTMSCGLNISSGLTKLVNLGYLSFFSVGAYSAAFCNVNLHLPIIVTLFISLIAGGILGAIFSIPGLKLKGNYMAMVTLGFGLIIYKLSQNLHYITGGPDGKTGIGQKLWILDLGNPFIQYYIIFEHRLVDFV